MGYEFGMLLQKKKKKADEDELKLMKMMPSLSHSRIMFPVNHGNTHWFLFENAVKERKIFVYDSLRHQHGPFVQKLIDLLQKIGKDSFPGEWETWETVHTTDDYIRQVDGHSYGVLMCFYAWRLANDRTLEDWNNGDVEAMRAAAKELRRELMVSIIGGKITMKNVKKPPVVP
jgi:Ulp1 family protease